ncbi:MAG: hypothetical protein JWO71_2992 [Candidatus Acidoferrum typicum]|nr:hypothetical protein [Candidatus Acidoferrum typicum]
MTFASAPVPTKCSKPPAPWHPSSTGLYIACYAVYVTLWLRAAETENTPRFLRLNWHIYGLR